MRFSILNNKVTRFLWVIIPPIIISVSLFFYFFRLYKPTTDQVAIDKYNQESPKITFDPLGVKEFLPKSLSSTLAFQLCLNNRNKVGEDVESLNLQDAPEELVQAVKNVGAMAVRASLIPELNFYKERNESGCVSVDIEKFLGSRVVSEINTGLGAFSLNDEESKAISEGRSINVSIQRLPVGISETWLYVRMQWSHFLFLTSSIFVGWFGLVLLFKNIVGFIMGSVSK